MTTAHPPGVFRLLLAWGSAALVGFSLAGCGGGGGEPGDGNYQITGATTPTPGPLSIHGEVQTAADPTDAVAEGAGKP